MTDAATEASQWAFYMAFLAFVGTVFKSVWDEFIRRRMRKEAKEEADALNRKTEEVARVAETTRQEIVAKVEENTAITEKAKDAAEKAVRVANHTHDKIVHIGERRNELFDALLAKVVGRDEETGDDGGTPAYTPGGDRPSQRG